MSTSYGFVVFVNLIEDDEGKRVEFDWMDTFNGQWTDDGETIDETVDEDENGYAIGAALMDDLLDRGIVPRTIEVST